MVKKKTFFFKKQNGFIDIGRVDPDTVDMLPPRVFKTFFGGYERIEAKNIDRALQKASKGRKVETITTGRVVKIIDDMMKG